MDGHVKNRDLHNSLKQLRLLFSQSYSIWLFRIVSLFDKISVSSLVYFYCSFDGLFLMTNLFFQQMGDSQRIVLRGITENSLTKLKVHFIRGQLLFVSRFLTKNVWVPLKLFYFFGGVSWKAPLSFYCVMDITDFVKYVVYGKRLSINQLLTLKNQLRFVFQNFIFAINFSKRNCYLQAL